MPVHPELHPELHPERRQVDRPGVPLLQAVAAMAMVGGAVTASGFLTGYPLFSAQAVRYALAALALVLVARHLSLIHISEPTRPY